MYNSESAILIPNFKIENLKITSQDDLCLQNSNPQTSGFPAVYDFRLLGCNVPKIISLAVVVVANSKLLKHCHR